MLIIESTSLWNLLYNVQNNKEYKTKLLERLFIKFNKKVMEINTDKNKKNYNNEGKLHEFWAPFTTKKSLAVDVNA